MSMNIYVYMHTRTCRTYMSTHTTCRTGKACVIIFRRAFTVLLSLRSWGYPVNVTSGNQGEHKNQMSYSCLM